MVPCCSSLYRTGPGGDGRKSWLGNWVSMRETRVPKGRWEHLLFTPFLDGQNLCATCHVLDSVLNMGINE